MATRQDAETQGTMKIIKPPLPMYSMRRLERMLGVNRSKLMGLVAGLDVQTYEGPHDSILVDGDGLKALMRKLGLDLTNHRD